MRGIWWHAGDQADALNHGWMLNCSDRQWHIANCQGTRVPRLTEFVTRLADQGDPLASKALAYIVQEQMKDGIR
jgi:hypothetical protein